ncbi:MAG TPA: homocysteine S-methyltransferase family protein [Methylomirabilota bacterium]
MSDLDQQLAQGDVILLDGAVGTQLQRLGVPMHGVAWAAQALHTHPDTVRHMHENYIRAGVDIITTNTYASARHNLEPLGLGDQVRELNLRGVVLAQQARDRGASARRVYVAGAISNFGILTDGEPRHADHPHSPGRSAITAEQARANLREQAEVLADAGVDLLLVESTGGMTHRRWVLDACLATGLPTWVGFKCRVEPGDPTVRIGYASDTALAEGLDLMRLGGAVATVFHSSLEDTTAALAVVRDRWSGPIGAYPEASRSDYTAPQRDASEPTRVSPQAFLERARGWVDDGVQVIGGCCGIDVDYIRLLRDGLPRRIAGPRPGRLTSSG